MVKLVDTPSSQKAFLLHALKNDFRPNGRKLHEMRDVSIKISEEEYGLVEVKLGRTNLIVRISSQIGKPFDDRPFEGTFMINSEVSPMASSMFENGKSSDEEVIVSRLIEKAIRRSNALDLESLCIISGEKVWHIRADIHFLNYDGGLIDASCIAVMTALQHYRKPDVAVSGTNITVYDVDVRQPVPLSILHVPICITYSFFNPVGKEENIKGDYNDEIAILDADMEEEFVRDGYLVITINKNRELIQVSKNGGLPIDGVILMELANKSLTICQELTEKIKHLLKDDEERRYKLGNYGLLEVGASR